MKIGIPHTIPHIGWKYLGQWAVVGLTDHSATDLAPGTESGGKVKFGHPLGQ